MPRPQALGWANLNGIAKAAASVREKKDRVKNGFQWRLKVCWGRRSFPGIIFEKRL